MKMRMRFSQMIGLLFIAFVVIIPVFLIDSDPLFGTVLILWFFLCVICFNLLKLIL